MVVEGTALIRRPVYEEQLKEDFGESGRWEHLIWLRNQVQAQPQPIPTEEENSVRKRFCLCCILRYVGDFSCFTSLVVNFEDNRLRFEGIDVSNFLLVGVPVVVGCDFSLGTS